jgi:hypothetical protein
MNIDTRNKVISIVLLGVIVYLSWVLVDSIRTPYQELERRNQVTAQVRHRMLNVRDALMKYNLKRNRFPKTLDSLLMFIKADSVLFSQADSLFRELPPLQFNLDSMLYSPRTGRPFYFVVVDTIRPNLYLLKDPDSKDVIGDTAKTTLLNAASWE